MYYLILISQQLNQVDIIFPKFRVEETEEQRLNILAMVTQLLIGSCEKHGNLESRVETLKHYIFTDFEKLY